MDSLNSSLRVLLPLLEELGTPRALAVAICCRHQAWNEVLSFTTDPRHYVDAERYFCDVQATSLLKKMGDLPTKGIDRRQAALTKWYDGERQCYKSNERLSPYLFGSSDCEETIERVFRSAREKILSWIGPCPPSLDSNRGRFGPGATFSDRGRRTTVPDKITSAPTLTHGAHWYLLPFWATSWGRLKPQDRGEAQFVRGNRFLTVPKTALVDRSIAVEPSINIFYQLGLGASLRQRLKDNAGWDLSRAQDVHREMAKTSSVDLAFSTLDLSNASDTVCRNLVKLLLPPSWFRELDALRSPSTLIDGRWHVLEKFSSMGNGYTFELETIVFSSLISAVLDERGARSRLGVDYFVFGDDLIVPDSLTSEVVAVLKFCGFSLNREKSFSGSVPFRESCGADYFGGRDVRPFFLKEQRNDPWELLPDCNGVRRALKRLAALRGRESLEALNPWLACLPSVVRNCTGPELLGDCVLHVDESQLRFRWKNSIRYFRAVVSVPRLLPWDHWRPEVILASALYGVGDGILGISPREPPLSYKVKWVPLS